jgi:hypothetical protein
VRVIHDFHASHFLIEMRAGDVVQTLLVDNLDRHMLACERVSDRPGLRARHGGLTGKDVDGELDDGKVTLAQSLLKVVEAREFSEDGLRLAALCAEVMSEV